MFTLTLTPLPHPHPQLSCLNGWADPDTAYTCDNQNVADGGCAPTDSRCRRRCKEAAKEATAYTRCNPPALPLQQETCHLPAARSRCIAVFACRSARAGAEERRQGGAPKS